MKKLVIFLSFAALILITSGFSRVEAVSGLAGTGGTDKYISTGSTIEFNKPIYGFAVTGSVNITVSLLILESGDSIDSGVYNYLDNSIELEPGEIFAFDDAISKMSVTNGGKIIVNYKE